MSITLSALQKQRRDSAANWTAENPTLLAGELGLESDTGYWKVGDGSTAWTSLAYVSGLGAEIPVSRLADGAAGQIIQTDTAGTGVEWSSTANLPLGTAAAPAYRFQGDPNTGIYSPGADQVAISTAGFQRATIDSSGRLLVGTSSNLGGTVSIAGGGLYLSANDSNAEMQLTRASANSGAPLYYFNKARGTYTSPTVVSDGDICGTINFRGHDGSTYIAGASISAAVDGTPGANDMPGRLVFSVTRDGASSPTESARINNLGAFKATTTGSVISATSSSHEFTNANTGEEYGVRIRQSAATSNIYPLYIETPGQAPNNTTSRFITCADSAAVRFEFRSNGGIANFSGNNVNLSDINTKKDISPAAGTWDCIKDWEIVNYRYKDQPDDADLNLGVIAQQVAESCPEVITVFSEAKEATEDRPAQEERLGVKEQQMHWMAIKALQEAQVRIEQLEAKVAALESA